MSEYAQYYTQETTGIRYRIGDLYGYPDSLIIARTGAAYDYGLQLLDKHDCIVLDFGSGRGHGVQKAEAALNPRLIVSIDKYSPYLKNQQLSLVKDDLPAAYGFIQARTDLPLCDDSIDVVTSMHVIEHLPNPSLFLKEVSRVLRRDGKLLLATPNRYNLVGNNPYDEQVYVGHEIRELLDQNGFSAQIYYLVANDRAMRIHERKKWIAANAPFTGKVRNKVPPVLWESLLYRSGISHRRLKVDDFHLSKKYHSNAIDIVALGVKAS